MPNSQQKLTDRRENFSNQNKTNRNVMLQAAREQLKASVSLLDATSLTGAAVKNVLQPINSNKVAGPFSMSDFKE